MKNIDNKILQTFEELNNEDIDYVVPRKYDLIMHGREQEIDMFIAQNKFSKGLEILQSHGFSNKRSNSGMINFNVITKGIKKPIDALKLVTTNPGTAFRRLILNQEFGGSSNPELGHYNIKLSNGDFELDVRNNIAYMSPQNGKRYPVEYEVNELLFSETKRYEYIKIPTPPNELGHLVPHCVFDKEGNFTQYYEDKCDRLKNQVFADHDYDSIFRRILRLVFYQADDLVYKMVNNGDYNNIRSELRKFDDY